MVFAFLVTAAATISSPSGPGPYARMDQWKFYRQGDACSLKGDVANNAELLIIKKRGFPSETVVMVGSRDWASVQIGKSYDASFHHIGVRVPTIKPVGLAGSEHTWFGFSVRAEFADRIFREGGYIQFYAGDKMLTYGEWPAYAGLVELNKCVGMTSDPFAPH